MLRYLRKNKEGSELGWFTGTGQDDSAITKIRKKELVGIRLMFKGDNPRHFDISWDDVEELHLKIKKDDDFRRQSA
jgi:hypothetical protein